MRHRTAGGALVLSAVLVTMCLAQPQDKAAQDKAAADEASLRALVKTFADARNAHDGQAAAALYSEDGEWMSANGQGIVRGRADLARIWSGQTGQVQRTVQSIEFVGPNVAVVHVATQYAEPIGRHNETFVVAKESGEWSIHLHQSVD
jgi:uncharacterized protein (TIGR02246 family)